MKVVQRYTGVDIIVMDLIFSVINAVLFKSTMNFGNIYSSGIIVIVAVLFKSTTNFGNIYGSGMRLRITVPPLLYWR